MRLKFFGQLAEITGKTELSISPEENTEAVINKMKQQFPKLKEQTFQIAVNRIIAKDNQQLEPDSEIAFLPPFAGG